MPEQTSTSPTSLQQILVERFNPAYAAGFDGVVAFDYGTGNVAAQIRDQKLRLIEPGETNPPAVDVTFFVKDHALLLDLLRGRRNAIESFMHGEYYSDGYLMWAFATMAMFSSDSLPVHPTE